MMRFGILVILLLATLTVTIVNAVAQDQAGVGAEMARKLQDPLANIAAIITDNDYKALSFMR